VKIIINPAVIISLVNANEGRWDEEPEDMLVFLEIINSTKCVTTFTVYAHILILMCGTPFVLVEFIMKEIQPVNAQILLLQFW